MGNITRYESFEDLKSAKVLKKESLIKNETVLKDFFAHLRKFRISKNISRINISKVDGE